MSLGTRFRSHPDASSLKTSVGAALVGVALLGGTVGIAAAQEASPSASPVAMVTWADQVQMESDVTFDGDRVSVGVVLGEVAEINVGSIEVRPYVILQTDNQTDTAQTAVLFMVPEDMDPATFEFPESEADLPEGVSAVGSYAVDPAMQASAVFTDLTPGAYVLATDSGLMVPFTVTEMIEIEVPDVFADPDATPDA